MYKSVKAARELRNVLTKPTTPCAKARLSMELREDYEECRDMMDAILGTAQALGVYDPDTSWHHMTQEGRQALEEMEAEAA